jgi:prepilin signal peptidase PulO-like enzyme (type II secretory pathway)
VVEEGSAWAALGFVLGIAGGGALAARLRGRSALAGRRCPRCGASLGLWAAVPILSWFAVRPRCPRCGEAVPRLHAAFEAGVVLIGTIALLLLPLRMAVPAAAAAWLLLLWLVWRRRT